MATDIDRYLPCWDGYDGAEMFEDDNGDWVNYEDHLKSVRKFKLTILQLKDDLEAARMEGAGYA